MLHKLRIRRILFEEVLEKRFNKKLYKFLFLLLIVIVLSIIAGVSFEACIMGKAFYKRIKRSEELVPDNGYAVVHRSSIEKGEYSSLNKLLDGEFEGKTGSSILRILYVEEGKCYFAASKKDVGRSCLLIASADVGGKSYEILGEFEIKDESSLEFGDTDSWNVSGKDIEYSQLAAFYYGGKLVVNNCDTVFEFDIKTQNSKETTANSYDFPEIKTRLCIDEDNTLLVIRGNDEFSMTFEEILASSHEMRFLYELEKQGYSFHGAIDFLYQVIYYDAEPYLVVRPVNRWGWSCAAVFKFEPDNRAFKYIDSIYVGGIPYHVYPIKVQAFQTNSGRGW